MIKMLSLNTFKKEMEKRVCLRVSCMGSREDFDIGFEGTTIAEIEEVCDHSTLVLYDNSTSTMVYRHVLGDIYEEQYLQEYWKEEMGDIVFYTIRSRILCVNGKSIVKDVVFGCKN